MRRTGANLYAGHEMDSVWNPGSTSSLRGRWKSLQARSVVDLNRRCRPWPLVLDWGGGRVGWPAGRGREGTHNLKVPS